MQFREARDARAAGRTVDVNGAGSALRDPTAELRPRPVRSIPARPYATGSGREQQYFYAGSAIGSVTISYVLGFSAAGFSNVDSPLALDNLAFQFTSVPVPEPAIYPMLVAGLLSLIGLSLRGRS